VTVADRPGVQVSVETGGDLSAPVIRVSGELDVASVEATRAGIEPYLNAATEHVTFDLEKLTFMDSSGIALLVKISNRVGRVTLINVTPIVHRVLEITGLLEHFGVRS
jgi:anti-anti-sigma factor